MTNVMTAALNPRTRRAPLILSLGLLIRNKLKKENQQKPQNEKDNFEQILADAGYAYDPYQNIFYSTMDPWQRKYGYCRLYDEAAAPLSMIFDCEPVYFEYNNKKWLIELWKGQYGMVTGGEVGVYTSEIPDLDIPDVFNGTFFKSASDTELLPISFTLIKNRRTLFKRKYTHWWLTGFVLGEFSEPSELAMDVSITLKDNAMRNAFVDGLRKTGYQSHEIKGVGNTVQLLFTTPRSPQPLTRTDLICKPMQAKNKFFCDEYQKLTKGLRDMSAIIKLIQVIRPEMYSMILNMGKPVQLYSDNFNKIFNH